MNKVILTAIFSIFTIVSANAQQTPQPIILSQALASAILNYLQVGGTRSQADTLASSLIEAAQAPQREAAKEAEIKRRVEEATKVNNPSSVK